VNGRPKTTAAGDVVSIGSRGGYRPDFKGLASGQVAVAREKMGLTHEEFAAHLDALLGWAPSAAAVKRWEQGSTPPGDVVLACAVISQEVPGDVLTLPLSVGAERRAGLMSAIGPALDNSGDAAGGVTPYADRGLITREQWNEIIRGATRRVWLYGMAEFGYASDAEVPGILSEITGRGCDVQVLLLSPDYPEAAAIDTDEGSPGGTLVTRTRAALARFQRMQQACGERMQIRVYSAHPTVSVVRGDDRMLVTPYLRFFVGSNSPTFEIRRAAAEKMFSRYERHFADTWDNAEEWTL
jgi:transcriptional regulator with XRE-family HTH domain